MNSDLSEETLNTSYSEPDERKLLQTKQDTTVAIFDWDDTLFCTKYLEMLQIDCKKIFSEEKSLEDYGAYLIREMQTLEEKIINLLSELVEREIRIFIITNADEKWLFNCLKHFLPDLNEFLTENKIETFSAKKIFGKNCGPDKWKIKCFKKVILDNFINKNENLKVVSIGDSVEEKQAVVALQGLN